MKTAIISVALIGATLFVLAKNAPVTSSVVQVAAACGEALGGKSAESSEPPAAEGMVCTAE